MWQLFCVICSDNGNADSTAVKELIQGDTKKRELLKNPTKIEEIQEKKIIDRNWTITTCRPGP